MSTQTAVDERLGAVPVDDGGYRFRVWAPRARSLSIVYPGRGDRRFPLGPTERGYFEGTDPEAREGDRYWVAVGRSQLPDPASRRQPDGVGGASALVDLPGLGPVRPGPGIELAKSVLYELHIGTFSPEGTFSGAIRRLDDLASVGVTAVELLPVEEERGDRGWGYGPVHQFAVRRSYGGPAGLVEFVNGAHDRGLSVLLDVVYNHWSGQAEFLERFGPYFHPRATTPWGPTPNMDGPGRDEVRRYFFDNARMWVEEYGVDGFRLDAVHEVYDRSSPPFWAEFSDHCRAVGSRARRRLALIAESDLNDTRILRASSDGGWGLDAEWSDDFHHALHAALTGERRGYYADFGSLEQLARAFERPLLFEGQYSRFREKTHGVAAGPVRADQFVVFDQNHDQVGNRGDGARLTGVLSTGLVRVGLGLLLFAPYVPMLFMGEEFGERRPFFFFADPPPAFAGRLVAGRNRQLRSNGFDVPPPNPTEVETMERCRLDWDRATSPEGRDYRTLVRELLKMRRELPALQTPATRAMAWEAERRLEVHRGSGGSAAILCANLGARPASFELPATSRWSVLLDSADGPSVREGPRDPRSAPLEVRAESFAILTAT